MAKTIAKMNAKIGMDSRSFDRGATNVTRRAQVMSRGFAGAGAKAAAFSTNLGALGVALPGVGSAIGLLGVASAAAGAGWGTLNAKMSPGVKMLAGVAAGAIALGVAVNVMGGAVRAAFRQFDDIDRIAKFSQQTGYSTESLSAWALAADKAGASEAQLNKGQQQLTRRVGEAARGYGEGARGLKMLGLEVAELEAMRPEDQFKAVAEAIAGQENQSLKAAAAYGVFGKSGQDLINVLNLGSAGLKDAESRARYLGLTFSRIDAAKIEQANDAITDLKASVTGFSRSLAVELAPQTEYYAKWLTEIIVLAREGAGFAASGFNVKSNTGAIAAMTSQAEAAAALNREFERQAELSKLVAKIQEASIPAHRQFSAGQQAATDAYRQGLINARQWSAEIDRLARDVYPDASTALDRMLAKVEEFGKTEIELQRRVIVESRNDDWLRQFDDAAARLKVLEDQQLETAKAAEAMEESQRKLAEVMARGAATTERYQTPAMRFKDRLIELREELAAGAIGFKTFLRAAADAGRELRGPDVAAPGARRGPVSAVTAGGAEDIRLRLAAGTGRPEAQREQVKEQRKGNRILDAIRLEIIKQQIANGEDVTL